MYAPSSYNEGLNGESLSCNSEKSDNYSDGHSAGGYSVSKIKCTIHITDIFLSKTCFHQKVQQISTASSNELWLDTTDVTNGNEMHATGHLT